MPDHNEGERNSAAANDEQEWVRFDRLVAKGVVKTRPTLSRYIRECNFPRGYQIGGRVRVWWWPDVVAWVKSNGGTDEERPAA